MKAKVIIEDGQSEILLTPETKWETSMLVNANNENLTPSISITPKRNMPYHHVVEEQQIRITFNRH